jgi:hypothetical protein
MGLRMGIGQVAENCRGGKHDCFAGIGPSIDERGKLAMRVEREIPVGR